MYTIEQIHAFNDNYIWVIRPTEQQKAIVVDPGDASVVLRYLQKHQLELSTILLTHHHADHSGGIATLCQHYPDTVVYSAANSPLTVVTHPLRDNDIIRCEGVTFQVITTPGHTLDHIAFYIADEQPVLFSGDTLFSAGCGRLFEGSAQQMYQSLVKIQTLPDSTAIYCAHEYTAANLIFALAVDPTNTELHKYKHHVERLRSQNIPTIPSTLAAEKAINPFLRTQEQSIISMVKERALIDQPSTPEAVFGALRTWKDTF